MADTLETPVPNKPTLSPLGGQAPTFRQLAEDKGALPRWMRDAMKGDEEWAAAATSAPAHATDAVARRPSGDRSPRRRGARRRRGRDVDSPWSYGLRVVRVRSSRRTRRGEGSEGKGDLVHAPPRVGERTDSRICDAAKIIDDDRRASSSRPGRRSGSARDTRRSSRSCDDSATRTRRTSRGSWARSGRARTRSSRGSWPRRKRSPRPRSAGSASARP